MEEREINQKIATAYEHAAPDDAAAVVAASGDAKQRKRSKFKLKYVLRVAAVLAVFLGIGTYALYGKQLLFSLSLSNTDLTDYVLAEAEYPARKLRTQNQENYPENYDEFAISTMRMVLTTGEDAENAVYSPLSAYMALAMLAEMTDGDTRAQVLDALGAEDLDTLRTQAQALWKGNYIKGGTTTSILSSSLWLNENVDFVQSTLDALASNYYASTYRGDLTSTACQNAILKWLNENTGNMLSDLGDTAASQRKNLELNADTVAAIFSAIYYEAKWSSKFDEDDTDRQTFHAADGDITCDFMNQTIESEYYWDAEQFGAIFMDFSETGSGMWLVLPDEGVSVDEVLADEALYVMLADGLTWTNGTYHVNQTAQVNTELRSFQAKVNLSMPKFDISAELDLKDTLTALGVTDAFDDTAADFTPLTESSGVYLSTSKQTVRVTADEEGIRAAAYTEMRFSSGMIESQPEEIDFVLDRPFLFVVVSDTGTILFSGVVNEP